MNKLIEKKWRFTFREWLILVNPKTSISITDVNGRMYKSIKRKGMDFTMEFCGIDYNKLLNQSHPAKDSGND